jgi:ribosomal protein L29
MLISQEGWEELQDRLSDRTIGIAALRVLLAAIGEMDRNNEVRAGRKDLARILAMDERAVARNLRLLIEVGFMERPRLKFSPYTVSPRFAWNSTREKLQGALKARGMLGRDGMMQPRQAA